MLKKQMFIMTLCLSFVLALCAQNESNETDFQKGYSITADVGGGFNKTFLYGHFCPGFGIGAGFRYDFHRLWGVSTGLRYEHFFDIKNDLVNFCNMLIPIEMEFHLPYFYVRGGVVLGLCFNSWMVSKSGEICNLGATLGVGGRIPLTKKDKLTIGLHGTFNNVWDINYRPPYYLDQYPRAKKYVIDEGLPRYVVMLRIGYEHRF